VEGLSDERRASCLVGGWFWRRVLCVCCCLLLGSGWRLGMPNLPLLLLLLLDDWNDACE
jgi:hypothetical protein